MVDEDLSHQPGNGDGQNAASAVADPSTQVDGQGQNPGQDQVGDPGSQTSSDGGQGSKGKGGNWAVERIVERALKRHLGNFQTTIADLIRENRPPVAAKADSSIAVSDTPDYNNLDAWINQKVERLLEQKLAQTLPQHLGKFETKLTEVSKTQEARNYLLSQKDIGGDKNKIEEIRQVIEANLLDDAVQTRPLQAIMRAVEIWREKKVNPSAPSRGQLSTVTGGSVTRGKRELGIEGLLALQKKYDSAITAEDKEKIALEIAAAT